MINDIIKNNEFIISPISQIPDDILRAFLVNGNKHVL